MRNHTRLCADLGEQVNSKLHQGCELAWALWIARIMEISISRKTAKLISEVDDDIVALVALDLHQAGLMPRVNFGLWRSHLSAENLYSDHSLLAYEAYEQQFLTASGRSDYIASDAVFELLRRHRVRFYNPMSPSGPARTFYSDEESSDVLAELEGGDMTLALTGDIELPGQS